MRLRSLSAALVAAAALTAATTSAVYADSIGGDADTDALATPHANSLDRTQAAGSSALYDFSAVVNNSGGSSKDVFTAPGDTVIASVSVSGAWAVADPQTPESLTFDRYDGVQGGKVRIDVPCGATASDKRTMTVALQVTSSKEAMSPDHVTLSYNITPTAPAPGTCTTNANTPPVVTIDPVDGPVDEGSPARLGATVTDDDVPSLEWSWTAKSGVDAGTACAFSTPAETATDITCNDDGVFTVTLTADDHVNAPVSASADIVVQNADPVITSATFGDVSLTCGSDNAGLSLAFTDAGENDTHMVSIDWDNDGVIDETMSGEASLTVPHTYGAGAHLAAIRVTDDDNGSTTTSATAVVNYKLSSLLQPINAAGTKSLFKYGSTIPVKVQVLDCDGLPALGLAPVIDVQKLSGSTPIGIDEIASTSAADSGSILRYSGDAGIYIYNLATKSLTDSTAAYRVTVTLPITGQSAYADIGMKK